MISDAFLTMTSYLPSLRQDAFECDRDHLISIYFNLGFVYNEIVQFLKKCHGTQLGVRQLKRNLKSKGLVRRKNKSPLQNVLNAVREELSGSGNSIGYRRVVIDHNLVVDRETIGVILKHLNPIGVEHRSRRTFRRRLY